MYQERTEVYVGDTGPVLEALITESDGETVRDLSGYSAWVTFWTVGATEPHVVRAAVIHSASSGLVRYYLRGDEYASVGDVQFQISVSSPEWGGTSAGRGHFVSSTPVMRRKVLAQP